MDSPRLKRALEPAPIRWTSEAIAIGKHRLDATDHVLSMIYPNPANPRRYVVIDSGHTFHEADFQGTNALLIQGSGIGALRTPAAEPL